MRLPGNYLCIMKNSIVTTINGLLRASFFCLLFGFTLMSFTNAEQTNTQLEATFSCPSASFSVQNNGCTGPCGITFVNESSGAVSYHWDFGDGNVSSDADPTHTYTAPGTYQVTLRAVGQTCTVEFIGEVDVIAI